MRLIGSIMVLGAALLTGGCVEDQYYSETTHYSGRVNPAADVYYSDKVSHGHQHRRHRSCQSQGYYSDQAPSARTYSSDRVATAPGGYSSDQTPAASGYSSDKTPAIASGYSSDRTPSVSSGYSSDQTPSTE